MKPFAPRIIILSAMSPPPAAPHPPRAARRHGGSEKGAMLASPPLAERVCSTTAVDAAPLAPHGIGAELMPAHERLAGMPRGVVRTIALVGVIAREGAQPAPQ